MSLDLYSKSKYTQECALVVPDSVVSSKLVVRDLENSRREPRHYFKLLLKGLALIVINLAILAGIVALAIALGLI